MSNSCYHSCHTLSNKMGFTPIVELASIYIHCIASTIMLVLCHLFSTDLIDIGFVLTTYTVMERQPYAVVQVEATGFPENISVVIEVNVMLLTSDDTAEGISVLLFNCVLLLLFLSCCCCCSFCCFSCSCACMCQIVYVFTCHDPPPQSIMTTLAGC